MAKSKLTAGGPFISIAAFCDRILTDKDGIISMVRIVDRIKIQPEQFSIFGDELAKHDGIAHVGLSFVVGFKSGDAQGEHAAEIILISPSGKKTSLATQVVNFMGNESGVNLQGPMSARITEEGLHWYEVLLNGKMMTKIPLYVEHLQVTKTESIPSSVGRPPKKKVKK